ncbi:hypothetical protein E4U10_006629 [Claviceps purpurea]|nr:hypothetical protein E4U10_006629 [Claviceps purpurea]
MSLRRQMHNTQRVTALDWSPYSPDLNLIQNLWSIFPLICATATRNFRKLCKLSSSTATVTVTLMGEDSSIVPGAWGPGAGGLELDHNGGIYGVRIQWKVETHTLASYVSR